MHSGFIHTAAAGMLLVAVACGKQLPDGDTGAPISFRSGVAAKALLDDGGLQGETITVNDIHEAADGTASPYMKDVPLEYSVGSWNTDPLYYWTKGGLHRFAAYVDGQGVSFRMGNGGENDTLESEEITLSADNQPDLLYAFAVRDLDKSSNPHAPVVLDFRHALAAIRLNISNMKYDGLDISGYRLLNIATAASFSVDRGAYDAGTQPYYDLSPASDGYGSDMQMTLPLNGTATLYAGESAVEADGSLLVWPQDVKSGAAAVTLEIDTSQGIISVPLSTSSVSSWRAGRRYVYDINLADNNIRVTATVQPWETNDVIID